MDSSIMLEIKYGGAFVQSRGLCNIAKIVYEGGDVKTIHTVDLDLVSYFEIMGYIKDIGVTGECKVYYKNPIKSLSIGLKLLSSDKEIPDLIMEATEAKRIILYVDHMNEDLEKIMSETPIQNETEFSTFEVGQGSTDVYYDDVFADIDQDELSDVNSMEHVSEGDEELDAVRRRLLDLKNDIRNVQHPPSEDEEADEGEQNRVGSDEPRETEDPIVDFPNDLNVDVTGYKSDEPIDSSDYATGEDSEDDRAGRVRKPKQKFPVFNTKLDMAKIEFEAGMRFSSPQELKDALKKYAVANMYQIRFTRSKKNLLLAKCMSGCPFRLYASWMQNEKSFQIKTLQPLHKCTRQTKIRLVTATWLANVFGDKIRQQPSWKCKDFKDEVNEKYKIKVTRLQCYLAKKKALGEVEKGLIEHYAMVKRYGKEILRSDPKNTFKLGVERATADDPPTFKRLYVCFHALKIGWIKGCRPVIGLDGCFLKSYCTGELLAAVGRDANNQMYPIAWAVVEVENTDSWSWFIDLLKGDLELDQEGKGVTLITDQQKGLDRAIADLLPRAEHRCCARHIYSNLRKSFTGTQLKTLFWRASKSSTQPEFEVVMKDINNLCKEANTWLRRHDPKLWCRGFFQTFSKCESVDNNMCECFNGTLIDARYKPLIDMLEEIRYTVIERMNRRRSLIEKWEGIYCPRALAKLNESIDNHRYFCTLYNGNLMFEVKMGLNGYVVDLQNKSCSCNMWELSGIPCSHAVSAIYYMNDDPLHYIHESLKVQKCKLAYGEYISSMNGKNMWPLDETEAILPPPQRRMPGRPQKARRKGVNEERKQGPTGFTISRTGRRMSCTNCQQLGHNRKTCKNPSVAPQKRKEPVPRKTKEPTQKQPKKTKGSSSRSARQNVDQVPNGFGVYISPQTGNTYVMTGGLPVQLNDERSSHITTQFSQATPGSGKPMTPKNKGTTSTALSTSPALNTRSRTVVGVKKNLGVRRRIMKK